MRNLDAGSQYPHKRQRERYNRNAVKRNADVSPTRFQIRLLIIRAHHADDSFLEGLMLSALLGHSHMRNHDVHVRLLTEPPNVQYLQENEKAGVIPRRTYSRARQRRIWDVRQK